MLGRLACIPGISLPIHISVRTRAHARTRTHMPMPVCTCTYINGMKGTRIVGIQRTMVER